MAGGGAPWAVGSRGGGRRGPMGRGEQGDGRRGPRGRGEQGGREEGLQGPWGGGVMGGGTPGAVGVRGDRSILMLFTAYTVRGLGADKQSQRAWAVLMIFTTLLKMM